MSDVICHFNVVILYVCNYFLRYGTIWIGHMELSGRRKYATPENTAPLKKWLDEHLHHPYPTKGEKISLARISQ